MVTGKVALGTTMLAKILPLALVVPLFLRLQRFDFLPRLDFDVTQFTYLLAIGVTTVVSFVEFRVAQGEKRGSESINVGMAVAGILTLAGLSFLVFVVVFDYNYTDFNTNQWISAYLGIAIFILAVQAAREILIGRKALKYTGL
jgi:uncharacterized membrane protein